MRATEGTTPIPISHTSEDKVCHITEGIRRLRKQAVRKGLGETRERGLAWKIFLGYLTLPTSPSVSLWLDTTKDHRERYTKYKLEHKVVNFEGCDFASESNSQVLIAEAKRGT
jgi:hypothetical protein